MSPIHLSLTAARVLATAFHSVAVLSTAFRLYRRYKQKNLWWDDGCVFVALLLDLVYCSSIALKQELSPVSLPPPPARYRQIVEQWIGSVLPHCVVWFSRISICLTIAKLDMQISISRIRTLFYFLIAAFGLFAVAMLVHRIWICAHDTSWYNIPPIRCYIGKARGIMSLAGDLLADTVLIALSLNLTWKVRMHPSQRRMLLVISLANILSSMAGILYGVTSILLHKLGPHRGLFAFLVTHIKTAVTLTVCNLLVVVTYVYAILRRTSSSDIDGTTSTKSATEGRPASGITKSTPEPPRTVYVLTQFDSNGSPLPPSQQGHVTAYGAKISQEPSSISSSSRYYSSPHEPSSVVSGPRPERPQNNYSSTTG